MIMEDEDWICTIEINVDEDILNSDLSDFWAPNLFSYEVFMY